MANKKFWVGMLVVVLVFGMTVIGCDNNSNEEEVLLRAYLKCERRNIPSFLNQIHQPP